jgi:hypothetical protein
MYQGKAQISFIMKRPFFNLFCTLSLPVIFSLFSCEVVDETRYDDCDRYKEPEKKTGIMASVQVVDVENNPIANQELEITMYKIPCGESANGLAEFKGLTNEEGIRQTAVAHYDLYNSLDEIHVFVHAINLGNGSEEADSQSVTFKYDDFSSDVVKTAAIQIKRNH